MSKQLQVLWENVLNDMRGKVSPVNFGLFTTSKLISFEDDIATIAAPSFSVTLLQSRFSNDIKASLDKHSGKDISVLFIPKNLSTQTSSEDMGPLFGAEEKPQVAEPQAAPQPLSIGHLPRVRSDYTFQTFAVSGSNQLAFVSAQTVATNIGKSYNPLFLYGPVGVGKTHLMHAIANHVYQQDPSKKILYITSEEFTNEVIDAIRTNNTAKMKKRFRSAYLLIIDDIQFIEGKEKVQEELFHTFNILIDQGSQICLSSDRPPQEIKKLEKRLSSRFAGGLTVDISQPDFELKAAIIGIKAQKYGFSIPPDVVALLAENAKDTRTLEGLVLRLVTQATTTNQDITMELAQKSLGLMQEEKRGVLHVEDIIKTICTFYALKPTQLKGPKRDASLVRARQVCMYLLYYELKLTYVEIGNLLGGRDHTTIMHGVEKMEKAVHNKEKITEDIMGIKRELAG